MVSANIYLVASVVIAASYYVLASQLALFAKSTKVLDVFKYSSNGDDAKKLYFVTLFHLGAIAVLVATCASTFLLEFLLVLYPDAQRLKIAKAVVMMLFAVLSLLSAVAGFRTFPKALDLLGKVQLTDSYLVEVVEMVKESIVEIAEDYKIVRGNEASKDLFSMHEVVGTRFTDLIHPDDVRNFTETANKVLSSFTSIPITIEYRIKQQALPQLCPTPTVGSFSRSKSITRNFFTRGSNGSNKIHATTESEEYDIEGALVPAAVDPSINDLRQNSAANSLKVRDTFEYIWIESTICKGICQQKHSANAVYDLKMVSRNIDDRKKEALTRYQNIVRETEERTRINAAKLRYLSCIAHDLKTPLQSFCFSLDLLNHTRLQPEQSEFVQQANVAVDLMKLTISQTMDISKALTGAKLMPRRTTVFLSTVLQRVEVIINGYGKQVPVTFEVSENIVDGIITDEEWLWQMLLNLLTNACKYTDKGSIKVLMTLTNTGIGANLSSPRAAIIREEGQTYTPTALSQEMLLVEVIDTGVGVSEDKLGSIFDAFAQVQEGQVTGTGLGLYGVRTRVEGLQGSCGARHNLQSSTGTGTVLWFSIPYTPDEVVASSSSGNASRAPKDDSRSGSVVSAESVIVAGAGGGASPPTATPSSSGVRKEAPSPEDVFHHGQELIRGQKLTAMVVEDTITVRKLMEKLLLKMGFASVVCYENGSKGLDAMMAAPVDIVFSDVQMPIMTGPEMVSRFRRFEVEALDTGTRLRRQLIVAVTANGSESGDCGKTGFDEICHKPLGMQDIYQVVIKYF